MKNIHRTLLQHMLGSDDRYLKKQWGFRNHFCASCGSSDDMELREMEKSGLVKLQKCKKIAKNYNVYNATKAGAIAIGFKKYQLSNTHLEN